MQKHDIVPTILHACPELQGVWDEYVADPGRTAGDYIDAGKLVDELIAYYGRGEREIFPRFFEVIERLIHEQDEEVQNIAIIGYLETLQTAASWKEFGSEVFVEWMLPETKRWWAEIHRWWAGGKNLMDIVRSEVASTPKDDLK